MPQCLTFSWITHSRMSRDDITRVAGPTFMLPNPIPEINKNQFFSPFWARSLCLKIEYGWVYISSCSKNEITEDSWYLESRGSDTDQFLFNGRISLLLKGRTSSRVRKSAGKNSGFRPRKRTCSVSSTRDTLVTMACSLWPACLLLSCQFSSLLLGAGQNIRQGGPGRGQGG